MTTTTYRPATRPMVVFLYNLMAERSRFAATLADFDTYMSDMEKEVNAQGPQAEFSLIKTMIDFVKETDADMPRRNTGRPVADVPAGYYALVNSNDGKTYFFKVDRPTEGKWAGRTFLKRVSGDSHLRVDRDQEPMILAAIARNPLEAAKRYGHETGTCGICHRRLTDPKSVAAGIGPVCAEKF